MPVLATNEKDLPLVFETMRNFAAGEDSFQDPIELSPNQCQKLVNVIVRDKFKARTRPGADALGAAQPGGAHPVDGLLYFDTPALEYVVAVINGAVYTWNGSAWSAALAGYSPVAGNRVALAQGVDKALLADGSGNCFSWDGTTFTDLGDSATSPPKAATIVLSHAGRMWAMGTAAAPDTVYASALLTFGVGDWNRTQWSFRVGMGEGDPIVGAASMQQFVMVVLKRSSICRALTDPTEIPANYSADQASDFISDSIGCVGRDAWCKYANDLFFLSDDGIYTIQRMDAAKDQWQLSAPISLPVQDFINRINPNYSYRAAATRYREFIFFSAPTDSSTYNNETAVYNARLKSWMGVFTGWTPAVWAETVFGGVKHLVFGDHVGQVNEWKDLEDPQDSGTYLDNAVAYATKAWTRSFVGGDLESPKSGYNAIARFNFGEATLKFTAVGSDAELRAWSRQLEPTGSILGGPDTLGESFTLASSQPSVLRGSLRGLPSFNELFVKIESDAGFWELRNFTVGMRLRPLKVK